MTCCSRRTLLSAAGIVALTPVARLAQAMPTTPALIQAAHNDTLIEMPAGRLMLQKGAALSVLDQHSDRPQILLHQGSALVTAKAHGQVQLKTAHAILTLDQGTAFVDTATLGSQMCLCDGQAQLSSKAGVLQTLAGQHDARWVSAQQITEISRPAGHYDDEVWMLAGQAPQWILPSRHRVHVRPGPMPA